MEESYRICVGPRSKEEEQYLISKGLLVQDSDGEYKDVSTDFSDEESFYERSNCSHPSPSGGIENINSAEFPSQNSDNDIKGKTLLDSSVLKSHEVVGESEGGVQSHDTVMEECYVGVQQEILEKTTEHHETQELYPVENAEVENSDLSSSGVNNTSFTTSALDYGSSDFDDTMATIERLLEFADELEKSEIIAELTSTSETSVPLPSSQFPTNSSNDIELASVGFVDQDNLLETPFLQDKVSASASSTGSRHIETTKSMEIRSGEKKSKNLMYPSSSLSPVVRKQVVDPKKRGKFFPPSQPRTLQNTLPPRPPRPVKETVQNKKLGTQVQNCGGVLKNPVSVKKRNNSVSNLYEHVVSPVKEYVNGRATLQKSKSTNDIRSLPIPHAKQPQF